MDKKKHCRRNVINYPSAELLQSACYEDYKRLIDTLIIGYSFRTLLIHQEVTYLLCLCK